MLADEEGKGVPLSDGYGDHGEEAAGVRGPRTTTTAGRLGARADAGSEPSQGGTEVAVVEVGLPPDGRGPVALRRGAGGAQLGGHAVPVVSLVIALGIVMSAAVPDGPDQPAGRVPPVHLGAASEGTEEKRSLAEEGGGSVSTVAGLAESVDEGGASSAEPVPGGGDRRAPDH